MLCADKKEVEWSCSELKICSFATSEEIERLRSRNALERLLAHSLLTPAQIRLLYKHQSKATSARGLRALGKRIAEADVARYCEGVYITKLWRVFAKFPRKDFNVNWQRSDLVKALMNAG